ncbi:MAG: sugar phosphate isomerase/epimerase [Verrucomicrobia bacterium]|nr:sugar phosphate isomerase/epimerase [Verrucomicrobiota bacterium]
MKRLIYTICSAICVAAVVSAVSGAEKAQPVKGPIGLQLYSLRDYFNDDVPQTLDRVRDMGFRIVELAGTYGNTPEKFREMLKERGLRPLAGHFSFDRLRDDPEGVAQEAKALGLRYAGCAWIPHDGAFDLEECKEAIKVFNNAGEVMAENRIRFFYHNHGYEFQPYKDGTLLDLMMRETNPKYVFYEMDLFWTVHPGKDPVALLEKYGRRWELMHLKDLKKGVKGDLSGSSDVRNDVALGTGQMDFPVIIMAARKAGVRFYFIEDESPSVLEQVPQSLEYLEQFKW